MLNKKKIESLILYGNTNPMQVSKGINMPYTTINTKLNRKSWKPDDIEKLAKYFNKPIAWFFDSDEPNSSIVSEEAVPYSRTCSSCADKDEIILLLKDKVSYLEEKVTNLEEKNQDLAERLNGVNRHDIGKTG